MPRLKPERAASITFDQTEAILAMGRNFGRWIPKGFWLLLVVLLALKPPLKLIKEARSFECFAPGGLIVVNCCFAEAIDLVGNGAFIDSGLGAR